MQTSEVPEHLTTSWLCTALMRIGTRLATHFDQHFVEAGITQAQFRALLAISSADKAGIAPSVLAEVLLIERATISVLTNRLVERGLLHRLPGENRRTFNLALTDEGTKLLYQLIPEAVTLADEILQGLPLTNLSEMQKSLMSIETHLRGGAKLDAKGERK